MFIDSLKIIQKRTSKNSAVLNILHELYINEFYAASLFLHAPKNIRKPLSFKFYFRYCLYSLSLSVPEKMKNSIFEMSIITQILNINNLRTTSAKNHLHTNRKLVEYSLKNVPTKAMFTLTAVEILLSEGRSALRPAQRGTGSERAIQLRRGTCPSPRQL